MTAQIGDTIVLDGAEKRLMGDLPIDDDVVVGTEGPGEFESTACWRGHVATWEVRGSDLWLTKVEGNLGLVANRPIPAPWLDGVVRIIDGEQLHYVHMGYASGYAAVIELDIARGVIRRRRRIEVPNLELSQNLRSEQSRGPEASAGGLPDIRHVNSPRGVSDDTPAWEWLPEARDLLPPESTTDAEGRPIRDPLMGEPSVAGFVNRSMRRRVWQARSARGLRPGAAMALAGYPRAKGAVLAEFESGQRTFLDAEMEARLCAAFEISADDRLAGQEADRLAHQAFWEAWADTPIAPVLKVPWHGPLLYRAPLSSHGSAEALEAWASGCANLVWRPVELYPSRKTLVRFSNTGIVMERVKRRGDSPRLPRVEHPSVA